MTSQAIINQKIASRSTQTTTPERRTFRPRQAAPLFWSCQRKLFRICFPGSFPNPPIETKPRIHRLEDVTRRSRLKSSAACSIFHDVKSFSCWIYDSSRNLQIDSWGEETQVMNWRCRSSTLCWWFSAISQKFTSFDIKTKFIPCKGQKYPSRVMWGKVKMRLNIIQSLLRGFPGKKKLISIQITNIMWLWVKIPTFNFGTPQKAFKIHSKSGGFPIPKKLP